MCGATDRWTLQFFLGRDVSCGAHGFDLLHKGAGVVAAVGHHMAGAAQGGYQLGAGALVTSLALRQGQAEGQTLIVHDGVDLGAQSPARETDGVIRTPFFFRLRRAGGRG